MIDSLLPVGYLPYTDLPQQGNSKLLNLEKSKSDWLKTCVTVDHRKKSDFDAGEYLKTKEIKAVNRAKTPEKYKSYQPIMIAK